MYQRAPNDGGDYSSYEPQPMYDPNALASPPSPYTPQPAPITVGPISGDNGSDSNSAPPQQVIPQPGMMYPMLQPDPGQVGMLPGQTYLPPGSDGGATIPRHPIYLGPAPTGSAPTPTPPTGGGAAQIGPAYLSQMFPNGIPQSNVDTSPENAVNAVLAKLMPMFGQQNRGLADMLANAGIVGGSTAGAMGDLSRQQTTDATAQLAPLYQTAQQMGVNQSEYNAGAQYGAGQYDTGTFNTMLANLLGMQNQDWLAQLQSQYGLASGSAGGQQSAFEPIYTQPTPPNFMNLGAAFAPSMTPAPPKLPAVSGGTGGTSG